MLPICQKNNLVDNKMIIVLKNWELPNLNNICLNTPE